MNHYAAELIDRHPLRFTASRKTALRKGRVKAAGTMKARAFLKLFLKPISQQKEPV